MSDPKASDSVGQIPTDVADEMVRRLFTDGGPEADERILFPESDEANSWKRFLDTVTGTISTFPRVSP